jgi:hypothetical protein
MIGRLLYVHTTDIKGAEMTTEEPVAVDIPVYCSEEEWGDFFEEINFNREAL